jgi:transposase
VSADDPLRSGHFNEGTVHMIVIGVDPHKRSHTAVAVSEVGEVVGERTVSAREQGFFELLRWARSLGGEPLFALEDGRHVSGRLERFLLARGERVVRVAPKLMASQRRSARTRGKSDPVDAAAVARAALREPGLPAARLDAEARELRLLVDHRDDLVRENNRDICRLRWHLHDLDPDLEPAERALRSQRTLERLDRKLARRPAASPLERVQLELARELVRQIRARLRRERELERRLAALTARQAPALLEIVGCGALTAAKLVGEIGAVERFPTDAQLAMHSGSAPLDASSGRQRRHRVNPSGNRQLNRALHTIAVTQARIHPDAKAYLERKQREGKTKREALRALKRHLARVVHRALTTGPTNNKTTLRLHAPVPPATPCLT